MSVCYSQLIINQMDTNLFLKTIDNFNELQIEILYNDHTFKVVDYNITEMLFAIMQIDSKSERLEDRLWVRAESCKLLNF